VTAGATGGPSHAYRLKKNRPSLIFARKWWQILPTCPRGDGSPGRRLIPQLDDTENAALSWANAAAPRAQTCQHVLATEAGGMAVDRTFERTPRLKVQILPDSRLSRIACRNSKAWAERDAGAAEWSISTGNDAQYWTFVYGRRPTRWRK